MKHKNFFKKLKLKNGGSITYDLNRSPSGNQNKNSYNDKPLCSQIINGTWEKEPPNFLTSLKWFTYLALSSRVLQLFRWETHRPTDITAYMHVPSIYIYIYSNQESHVLCQSGLPNVNSKLGLLQLRSPHLFTWSFDLCSWELTLIIIFMTTWENYIYTFILMMFT